MSTTFRRIALGLLLVVVLLFTAGFLFARFWLDGYLRDKLIAATDSGSEQMYALQLDRLHVNIFTGSADLQGIHLRTDSLRWEELRHQHPEKTLPRIDLQISSMDLRHFNWRQFWRNKDLIVRSIEIRDPVLKLASVKDTVIEKNPETDTLTRRMLDRLPQLLAPTAKSLRIGSIEIYNGKMTYRAQQPRVFTYQQADSIDWVLSNLHIEAGDTVQSGKALYAENIYLQVRNYELWPPGSVYAYRFKSVTLSGRDSTVLMTGASVVPTISDGEFMQRFSKIRRPRLRAQANEVAVRGLNLFRALHQNEWVMSSLTVDGVAHDFLGVGSRGLILPTAMNIMYYGPVYACVQGLVRPELRAVAASVMLFSQNLIGLGLGPLFFGMLSDAFKPMAGADSVQWVLFGAAWLGLFPAFFFWRASLRLAPEMAAKADD